MASIGETLREARMRQRLDITDVEERTKIRAKYLRALENEEFGMLPGSTFVKTFLRTYAEVLGLDPHALVEEYRAAYEPREEAEVQPIAPGTQPPRGRERERRYGGGGGPGPGTIVAGIVVLILAVFLVLGLTSGSEDKGSKQAAGTTQTKPKKPPAARKKPKPKPASALVTVQITPNGPVYMCVDRGLGQKVLYNGTTADPQTFKGRKLRVNLGRTAVGIKVNGRAFQVPQAANPVGYEFRATGSKQLPQGQRPTCA
jgi:transcriptional regulator with XRE-family HTH domain